MSDEVVAQEAIEESAPIQEEVAEAVEASPEEVVEEAPQVQAETEEELEQEIQEAAENGASEEEIKDMIRQYTIKVDGKEMVREIDLNNEEEMIRQLQLAAKGQKSTQELAEIKKQYGAGLQEIMANPFKALKALNPDFDPLEYAAKFIEDQYKEHQMSPEEKEARAEKEELTKLREERDRLAKEKEEREQAETRRALADEIQDDIMSALNGDEDLNPTKEVIGLVAQELMWAVSNGYEMSAAEVLPTVKEQLRQQYEEANSVFKNTDVLKKYMGKSLLEQLREERVQQAKEKINSVNTIAKDVGKKPSIQEEKEAPKKKLSELFGR